MSLIDIYQRLDVDPKTRSRLIKHAMTFTGEGKRASIIPPAMRRRLVAKNSADYEYIAREYLGRADGRLFYDPLPDPDEHWTAPTFPTHAWIKEQTLKAMKPGMKSVLARQVVEKLKAIKPGLKPKASVATVRSDDSQGMAGDLDA